MSQEAIKISQRSAIATALVNPSAFEETFTHMVESIRLTDAR